MWSVGRASSSWRAWVGSPSRSGADRNDGVKRFVAGKIPSDVPDMRAKKLKSHRVYLERREMRSGSSRAPRAHSASANGMLDDAAGHNARSRVPKAGRRRAGGIEEGVV